MHVHIESESNSSRYLDRYRLNDADVAYDAAKHAHSTLMAGFTTVRDLGGSGVNISLRKAIAAGKVPGPRIYTAGKTIASTGGHGDPTNGNRDELMGDSGPKEGVSIPPMLEKPYVSAYKNGGRLDQNHRYRRCVECG